MLLYAPEFATLETPRIGNSNQKNSTKGLMKTHRLLSAIATICLVTSLYAEESNTQTQERFSLAPLEKPLLRRIPSRPVQKKFSQSLPVVRMEITPTPEVAVPRQTNNIAPPQYLVKIESQSDYLGWVGEDFQWHKGVNMHIDLSQNSGLDIGGEPGTVKSFKLWFRFPSNLKRDRYTFGPYLEQYVPQRDVLHNTGRSEYQTIVGMMFGLNF